MPSADRLVWIDLEMTGLDPLGCHILEIATLVTDNDLEILAEGPNLVVHATDEELATLSDWSREYFTKSGLIEKARASEVSLEEAEAQTVAFLEEHCTKGTSPLCGNSVHMDRAFLREHMRTLHDFLHYRNIDVSTYKETIQRWFPKRYAPPMKKGNHAALADIRESIDELRYYRETFLK